MIGLVCRACNSRNIAVMRNMVWNCGSGWIFLGNVSTPLSTCWVLSPGSLLGVHPLGHAGGKQASHT
eukprot:6089783-Amphidinium_carterae.1